MTYPIFETTFFFYKKESCLNVSLKKFFQLNPVLWFHFGEKQCRPRPCSHLILTRLLRHPVTEIVRKNHKHMQVGKLCRNSRNLQVGIVKARKWLCMKMFKKTIIFDSISSNMWISVVYASVTSTMKQAIGWLDKIIRSVVFYVLSVNFFSWKQFSVWSSNLERSHLVRKF